MYEIYKSPRCTFKQWKSTCQNERISKICEL